MKELRRIGETVSEIAETEKATLLGAKGFRESKALERSVGEEQS